MQIELSEEEQRIAKWLAKSRFLTARKRGIENKKIGPQSNWETDLEGIAAEIAFCKMCNIYPDLTIKPRSGGYDCILDGMKVDVKSTKYKTGRLIATLKKETEDTDIYVLMIGTFPVYSYIGYAYARNLFNKDNVRDLGRGKGFVLGQNKLIKSLPIGGITCE